MLWFAGTFVYAPGMLHVGLSSSFRHTVLLFFFLHVFFKLSAQMGDVFPVLIISCKADCDCGCWFSSQRGIGIHPVHCTV